MHSEVVSNMVYDHIYALNGDNGIQKRVILLINSEANK